MLACRFCGLRSTYPAKVTVVLLQVEGLRRQELEIFDRRIKGVAVFVVDDFMSRQRAAKEVLHDQSVNSKTSLTPIHHEVDGWIAPPKRDALPAQSRQCRTKANNFLLLVGKQRRANGTDDWAQWFVGPAHCVVKTAQTPRDVLSFAVGKRTRTHRRFHNETMLMDASRG